MCNHQSPDPISLFSQLLPEWGQAADQLYQNYHFIHQVISQANRRVVSDAALQELLQLRTTLVRTIVELIQNLPPASHRISNENGESINRFNAHTDTLKIINRQTEETLATLFQMYPTLKAWVESVDFD
ncbi:hypothetical protein ACFPMF_04855 [Larkinella bovis]|uniref:Uncharacterized protein n=1 Tax=Larkinella bovis TaxID=683041 RepID=A0ABW0I5H1_9BACT